MGLLKQSTTQSLDIRVECVPSAEGSDQSTTLITVTKRLRRGKLSASPSAVFFVVGATAVSYLQA